MSTLQRPPAPSSEHGQALLTAAINLAAQGDILEARQAAEAAMVIGFSGPSLLLVHALCCARLGDTAAATRSVDAAVASTSGLDAKSRAVFDHTLADVRAALMSGQQGTAQRQLAQSARDLYGT